MTNEIRRSQASDAELRLRALRDTSRQPGSVNEKDQLAFEERLKILREGRDSEWAVMGDERSAASPEETASAGADRSAARPEKREEMKNPLSGFGESAFSKPKQDEEETESKAVSSNIFDLVGQMSARMAGGDAGSVPAPAREVPVSRHELVAKVAEAAETMLVMEARSATGRSEIKIDFKPDFLPDTGVTVSRSGPDSTLEVSFDTASARVNMFLENSNASLRDQLAQRFGCDVTVTVNYNRHDESASGQERDQRGRRPDWDGLMDGPDA